MSSSVPNLGIVGVGNWGKNLLRNFEALPECRVAAVCDRDPGVLEGVRRRHAETFITDDFDQLLARTDLDAIVIASSAVTHAPLGLKALKSGRDVFLEKPMALSSADAEALLRSAEETDRVLMVGHLLLYHPAVDLLRKLVREEELGDVLYINCQRVNLGQIRKDENALWSFAPHDVSVVSELFQSSPVSVSARGAAYLRQGVEDVVFLNIKYPDERMAHIHVSWLDPHKLRQITVVGSRKMVVFDDMQPTEKIKIYDKGVSGPAFVAYDQALSLRFGDIVVPHLEMSEPLRLECQHFVQCVRDRRPPRTGGEAGLRVVQVLEAAQRSLQEDGKPVAPERAR